MFGLDICPVGKQQADLHDAASALATIDESELRMANIRPYLEETLGIATRGATHNVKTVTLDEAYPDERFAIARLEELLGAEVTRLRIKKLDLVNDTTVVDVCFRLDSPETEVGAPAGHPELAEMARGQR